MIYVLVVFPWDAKEVKKLVSEKYNNSRIKVAMCSVRNKEQTFSRKILNVIQKIFNIFPGFVLLEGKDIKEEDMLVYSEYINHWDSVWDYLVSNDVKQIVKVTDLGREKVLWDYTINAPELDYFEYHVSWHCNLKCKGCGHYSNLQDQPLFGDLNQYKKDLARIHELVQNVKTIKLLGGEPFLNPELPEFIKATRDEFEGASIRVVTNGLLIPKCDDSILVAMKDNNARLEVTQYPPTQKIVDKISERCNQYDIPLFISPLVKEFFSVSDGSEIGDIKENWDMCGVKTCHFLYDGKLAVCGGPIFHDVMKDKVDYKGKINSNDVVDLSDSTLTGEQLVKRMNTPIDMCKYCIKTDFFPWEGGCKTYYTYQMLKEG